MCAKFVTVFSSAYFIFFKILKIHKITLMCKEKILEDMILVNLFEDSKKYFDRHLIW